ncbi:MAG TPA: glycosyltransferase, partial [Rhodocyclaceae bacterium]
AYSHHYGIGLIRPFITAHLRRFHNRADTTLVPTRALAGSLQQQGYRNVGLMSRGVDIRLFQPARRSAYLREQWQVADDALVVSYIGRIAAEKNIGLVLSAFAEIARQRPDSRLLFVGDGPMLAELMRRHPEHIYAGMRRGEDLAAHYASADLFLFPSLTETFGNVTSEALASGLGVVAYNCAAAAELIEDGHNGFLAAPDDVSDFIQSALRLAADPVLMSRVRMRAAASVSRLDWNTVHDEFAATLRRVIDTHERKRLVRDALVTAD